MLAFLLYTNFSIPIFSLIAIIDFLLILFDESDDAFVVGFLVNPCLENLKVQVYKMSSQTRKTITISRSKEAQISGTAEHFILSLCKAQQLNNLYI